jgi:hypothetical protein
MIQPKETDMKITDRMKAIGYGAVIALSLIGTGYSVGVISKATGAEALPVPKTDLGRSVRAGDVGCSRFPNSPRCKGK